MLIQIYVAIYRYSQQNFGHFIQVLVYSRYNELPGWSAMGVSDITITIFQKFSGGVWNLMTCFHRKDDPNKKDAIVFRVINQMNIEINNYSMDRDFIAMQVSCDSIWFVWIFLRQIYRKISNIRRTKSPNLNVSRLVLQLSLPNPMKPGVKSRMKMQLEQRRQAMLQLHLSDRQFCCLLRCDLY